MGRGNVRVTGAYEGLYYINNDDLFVFTSLNEHGESETKLLGELTAEELERYEFDNFQTRIRQDNVEEEILCGMQARFTSLEPCGRWISRTQKAIMENNLFYVALEDNEWSLAVELLQKEDDYANITGLQSRHWQAYLQGIRDILLGLFERIHIYAGPWTSGTRGVTGK